MTSKLIVLFCLAAIATCGQAKSPSSYSEAKIVLKADLFDAVTKALQNLTKTVTDLVNGALTTVTDLIAQLSEAAQDLIDTLTGTLNGVVQTLVDQINALAKAAKDKGLDPAGCVGTSITDLTELPTNAINNVTECVTSKVAETVNTINDKVQDITSVLTDLTQIGVDISNCKNKAFLLQPICITSITADIASKVVSLPIKVTSAVASLVTLVPAAIVELAACEVGVVGEVTEKGGKIVKDVADCIAKL